MKQKVRITANQFDQALLEQIEHARNLNIPANAISSAACFCDLVAKRLFGLREPSKRSEALIKAFQKVLEDARVERAEYETKMREQLRRKQETKRASQSRIIVPGRSNLQ